MASLALEDVIKGFKAKVLAFEASALYSSDSRARACSFLIEASKCQLFLPYGINKVLCTIGMVYPAKQVHGNSVLQGHAKVHVDKVEANYKDYLLPVATEEFSKIGETVLSFIQWPTMYIELTKASNSNQTGNEKFVAANTSTQTASKEKQELIKKMNSYRGQILKRACVRSTYERWMRKTLFKTLVVKLF
ncbi:hypothetical protein Tco_0636765 [Tanacetum coccineum]